MKASFCEEGEQKIVTSPTVRTSYITCKVSWQVTKQQTLLAILCFYKSLFIHICQTVLEDRQQSHLLDGNLAWDGGKCQLLMITELAELGTRKQFLYFQSSTELTIWLALRKYQHSSIASKILLVEDLSGLHLPFNKEFLKAFLKDSDFNTGSAETCKSQNLYWQQLMLTQ